MKHRDFKIGERVYVSGFHCLATIEKINGKKQDTTLAEKSRVILKREDDGAEIKCFGERVYKIAPRISEEVGEIVCYEHMLKDYPFYLPERDENYYRFELGLYKSQKQ